MKWDVFRMPHSAERETALGVLLHQIECPVLNRFRCIRRLKVFCPLNRSAISLGRKETIASIFTDFNDLKVQQEAGFVVRWTGFARFWRGRCRWFGGVAR